MHDDPLTAERSLALDATEFIRQRRADEMNLRTLSIEQRGQMIEAACRTAAEILRNRIAGGGLPPTPAPWPPSTLAFLCRHAPHGRT